MAYMTAMTFEAFLALESVKAMDPFSRNFAISEVEELMQDGCTAFEKHGCFTPHNLYENVLAICKELDFKISEYIKHWEVNRGGSGKTVFIAFTDAINSTWARSDLYKPVIFNQQL